MATRQPRYPSILTPDIFSETAAPPRGFLSQLGMVIFQPAAFFHSLAVTNRSRSWLWAAILILLIIGFSAVQLSGSADVGGDVGAPGLTPDMGMEEVPIGPLPQDGSAPADGSADPAAAWMTGLKTAGAQVLKWAVLVIVLAEVTMFNGHAPRLARNLQIAIWTSVPLALMAVLQLVYQANGGSIGAHGLTGFLENWQAFSDFDFYIRSFIYGIAAQLTIFWLWSLVLIYIASRTALHGKRAVVMLVVLLWIVILGIGSGYPYYKDAKAAASEPVLEEVIPAGAVESGDIITDEMPDSLVPVEVETDLKEGRQP